MEYFYRSHKRNPVSNLKQLIMGKFYIIYIYYFLYMNYYYIFYYLLFNINIMLDYL